MEFPIRWINRMGDFAAHHDYGYPACDLPGSTVQSKSWTHSVWIAKHNSRNFAHKRWMQEWTSRRTSLLVPTMPVEVQPSFYPCSDHESVQGCDELFETKASSPISWLTSKQASKTGEGAWERYQQDEQLEKRQEVERREEERQESQRREDERQERERREEEQREAKRREAERQEREQQEEERREAKRREEERQERERQEKKRWENKLQEKKRQENQAEKKQQRDEQWATRHSDEGLEDQREVEGSGEDASRNVGEATEQAEGAIETEEEEA
jgi:hypothetical protein